VGPAHTERTLFSTAVERRGVFPVDVTTERLRLSRLTRDRVDPLTLYDHAGRSGTIAEETRHLSWSPHDHPKATREFLAGAEEGWEDAEEAVYAVFVRDGGGDGEDGAGAATGPAEDPFAGTTGLHFEWEKRTANLGIWLRKPYWGRGYSGERARAAMALAFDVLDLDLVAACCFPENEQSRRAIAKYVDATGGRYEGRLRNHVVDDDGVAHDAHRYAVSAVEWREATGGEYDATFGWD
jgi:RimJ/RimL family protein N-acetyltransferase